MKINAKAFYVAASIVVALLQVAPAFAAAPQDTYSYVGDFPVSSGMECPIVQNASRLAAANDQIYVPEANYHKVHIFNGSGDLVKTLGSQRGSDNGQFDYPHAAAVSGGNVYILDERIQILDAAGQYISQFGSGINDGQYFAPRDIAVDTAGNVYVTDPYGYRIQKFTSNGVFLGQYGGAQFSSVLGMPGSIAVDSVGNSYVTRDYSAVLKFDASGAYVGQVASQGGGVDQYDSVRSVAIGGGDSLYVTSHTSYIGSVIKVYDSTGVYSGRFGLSSPSGGIFAINASVAIDGVSGDFYVSGNGNIQKFNAAGVYLWQEVMPQVPDSNLCAPKSAKIGPDGNLYVLDSSPDGGGTAPNNIKVYAMDGTFIRTIGASGSNEMSVPSDFDFDASGNIYVADTYNSRVQKFAPDGAYLSSLGSSVFDSDWVWGIAIDSQGYMYVSGDESVYKFDPNGIFIHEFGSYGTGDGEFSWSTGIAIDASDNVYVGDRRYGMNSRVQKFDSDGNFVGQFGQGIISSIYDIEIDRFGNIYTAGDWDGGVYKFNSSGIFLTSFNMPGDANAIDDSVKQGVTLDGNGNVYVMEDGSCCSVPSRISIWNAPIIASAPQNVAITPVNNTALRATWTSPAYVGSAALTGYRVMYRAVSTTTWLLAGQTDATNYALMINGLSPDERYEVQVISMNALGASTDVPTQLLDGVATMQATLTDTTTDKAMLAETGMSLMSALAVSMTLLAGGGVGVILWLQKRG